VIDIYEDIVKIHFLKKRSSSLVLGVWLFNESKQARCIRLRITGLHLGTNSQTCVAVICLITCVCHSSSYSTDLERLPSSEKPLPASVATISQDEKLYIYTLNPEHFILLMFFKYFTNQLTSSMEQNSFWEANNCSDSLQIPRILWHLGFITMFTRARLNSPHGAAYCLRSY
jgi:hypothetical protein